MDIFEKYCSDVCSELKSATARERKEVAAELRAHLEDHAAALIDAGRSEAEAQEAAVKAMGDAAEVGKALDKEFPILWLIVSRAAAVLAVILVFMLISTLRDCAYILENSLHARNDPTYFEEYENLIDYRYEIPNTNDILYIYGCDIGYEESMGYIASIGLCCYDKNLFGGVSSSSTTLLFDYYDSVLGAYRNDGAVGGGGFSTYGVAHRSFRVPVQPGQESITAQYDRFDVSFEIEIPLNWEGVE